MTIRSKATSSLVPAASLAMLAAATLASSASPVGYPSAATQTPPATVTTVGPGNGAVLSPLGMVVQDPPRPVRGADGETHLAYEITIINQTPSAVTIERVAPRTRGERLGTALRSTQLDSLLRVNGGGGPTIPGGGSALLFVDVEYANTVPTPRRLHHGFKMTLGDPSAPDQEIAFVGVPTRVKQNPAIEVAPPLRGTNWVVGNGCCQPINSHRGATLSIDGTVHVPERFAIDFVRLNDNRRLFEGPIDDFSSWDFYGDKIRSASAGRVVRLQDGLPDETPGELPAGQTVQTAGGNYVVVRIDRSHYAFYAHMQPGSLRVELGQRVRSGQVLGLLGNSGNTDAPHLHFHIMASPSPLESNGLPFVFRGFTGEGVVTDEEALNSGEVVPIDRQELDGAFRNRMPLGNQVVDFPTSTARDDMVRD